VAELAPEPSFAEIAEALLELVRHDARMNAIVEPFMAGLPEWAPGMRNAHRQWQRRMVLLAFAQRYFVAMVPNEEAHRALMREADAAPAAF
jgi:hypothetical protein